MTFFESDLKFFCLEKTEATVLTNKVNCWPGVDDKKKTPSR